MWKSDSEAENETVVAANVIHLLDEPYQALHELERVCRSGGKIIIPTYMNQTDKGKTNGVSDAIGKAGADFKREFTLDTYKQFFADVGYTDAVYALCEGRIPCAVTILTKKRKGSEVMKIKTFDESITEDIDHAFTGSDRLGVPVILETDAKSKCDKYVHLGMELAGGARHRSVWQAV